MFSKTLVERKRLDRTLPAIINGLSATQARSQGLIDNTSDADKSTTTSHNTLFVTGESDEEIERIAPVSHATTTKVSKPDPSKLAIPNAISSVFPNPYSPAKPNTISLTSAPQTHGDLLSVSPGKISSSFGKLSSYAISTPTLLPDAPANTGIFKPQSIFQDTLSKETVKLNPEPSPSTGGFPVFKFVESSQTSAISSPEPENLVVPNAIPKPTLENKPVHLDISEKTEPTATLQSRAPAERSVQHQKSLSYSTPFTFDPYNQNVPSKPYLPLEKPKVLQDFPSTGRTSLLSQDISPISMSFASNQKLAAIGNDTTVTRSPIDPHHSMNMKTANMSQPSVSLAAPQTNSFPTVTSIQESSATDFRLLPRKLPLPGLDTALDEVRQGSAGRTDLMGTSQTDTINLDRRSIVLSTLSNGIMHNDGTLLQQFVEYVIGPIIIDSIRETRDRRSWKQASQ